MLKKYGFVLLATMLIAHPVFADEDMSSDDASCESIVKACLDAGFTRTDTENKQFWKDCMKPLVLGKSVENVTVDAKDVKACRTAKIKQLTKMLTELKKANK